MSLTSKHYRDRAYVQKRVMMAEGHGQNPYHSRHIDQFCAYADLVAESAKAEVIEMLRISGLFPELEVSGELIYRSPIFSKIIVLSKFPLLRWGIDSAIFV